MKKIIVSIFGILAMFSLTSYSCNHGYGIGNVCKNPIVQGISYFKNASEKDPSKIVTCGMYIEEVINIYGASQVKSKKVIVQDFKKMWARYQSTVPYLKAKETSDWINNTANGSHEDYENIVKVFMETVTLECKRSPRLQFNDVFVLTYKVLKSSDRI